MMILARPLSARARRRTLPAFTLRLGALGAVAALLTATPAAAQPTTDDDAPQDQRSDASRAHQACLREAWQGAGAPCFRRWLAAYDEDASPAERRRADQELARADAPVIRSLDAAAFVTVRDVALRDVWIDGEPVGRAPLERVPLAPGAHAIELRPGAGGATMRDVVLFAGEEDLVEFKGGTPADSTEPGARPPGAASQGAPGGGARAPGTSPGANISGASVPGATVPGAVFDFCAPKDGLSRPRVLMLALAGIDRLEQTGDLAKVGAGTLARQVFAGRFPLVRFENISALASGELAWLDAETLAITEVTEHLARAAGDGDDLDAREGRFAAYSAACADGLVVPAITDHTFKWEVSQVKGKNGKTTTTRTLRLEMGAALSIFRREGSAFVRVAKLETSAPRLHDILSDLALASMPTTGIGGMDTLDLVTTAAGGTDHLSAVPDAACLVALAPGEGVGALLRCAKRGSSRVELAAKAVDERLGPECQAARSDGSDQALVTCEVRARTFQLTRSLKKMARGVDGWRLSAPLAASRGDDVLALGEKEGIEVGYGFVALDADGERLGYYKVTDVGEGGRPSRVRPRAGSVPQGTTLQEYPQMGLTLGALGFGHGVLLNDAPTLIGDVLVGPAPWVAGGLLEVGYDLSGALGSVETHLRLDVGLGGGPGVGANTVIIPTDLWIEKGVYLADRLTLFGAIGGGFQVVVVQIVAAPGVEEQALQAYGGGPAARAGFAIQLHPDVELRFEGVGRGSVVPAAYEPSEDGEVLPPGWAAREDRWFMVGGRAGLGFLL